MRFFNGYCCFDDFIMKVKPNIPDLQGKTILIAEDEEINFFFIETLVEPTGAEVKHVWNGQQAIDEVKSNANIDLILMDIKMPIVDGYQATREIKQLRPELPVVAQTAYALGDDKILCFEAGCNEYISKPIRKDIFYSILQKLLSY